MNNGFEAEVLKQVAEKLLMRKEEIILLLQGKVDNPLKTANETVSSLVKQGFITVAPVGNSTYAVTQKGMRAAKV